MLVQMVKMAVMESSDESVAEDPLEFLENLASMELLDQKVILDLQDPRGNKANPVHLVTKVKVAKMATTDLLDLQVINSLNKKIFRIFFFAPRN
jgi:hypothetical protein